jgi:hypothetical protein
MVKAFSFQQSAFSKKRKKFPHVPKLYLETATVAKLSLAGKGFPSTAWERDETYLKKRSSPFLG